MLKIGVTGHRQLENILMLSEMVEVSLIKTLTLFNERSFRIVSPLAEGADRLVAKVAIEKFNARLIVPLPMAKVIYIEDFAASDSIKEFNKYIELAVEVIEMPKKLTKEESYLATGMYVLETCDVLIAIWDGKPKKGMGGTGEIVDEALKRDMPIIWISTVGDRTIEYFNFPEG